MKAPTLTNTEWYVLGFWWDTTANGDPFDALRCAQIASARSHLKFDQILELNLEGMAIVVNAHARTPTTKRFSKGRQKSPAKTITREATPLEKQQSAVFMELLQNEHGGEDLCTN